jgi:hypothetical protein
MATNIDKALYTTPVPMMGLGAAMEEPAIEIEIENPDSVTVGVGGLEIELEPGDEGPDSFDANLAEYMDEGALQTLAGQLISDVDEDLQSRKDWEKTYSEGLKLLGLKVEERTEPWDGACGVFSPLLTEAVVRFQSESITEVFPAAGPVKTSIIGKKTQEKEDAANRVRDDMNYQLTEVMTEYRPEHEKMLWNLPIAGSAFKKVYYDPNLRRQVSMFVPAEDIILPYGTSELSSCPRVTHRMRKSKNDIVKLQAAGFYRDMDLSDPTKDVTEIQKSKDEETGFSASYDDRYHIYEIHAELDLPGFEDEEDGEATGIALPYVVTILKDTQEILSIRRNYLEDDQTRQARQHFVHYQYVPGFGSYGFGLIHLIGGAAKSATSLTRQLVDAGTLANLPGGLKSRGLRIKGDETPIAPGEFRDVDVPSGTVRDNIMPLPYKEPSQTLLSLLNGIVDEARRFAATADMKVSDMSAQAPVGTTLALLERQLKIMSAVQARMHFAMKQELKLLAAIIRDYTDEDYSYEAESPEGARAKRSDYRYTEIIPVSDPNAATMSQRVVQYQAVLQLAQGAPQIYNLPKLHRQMLEVLGIKNAEKLVELPEDRKPTDPVTENMDVLRMKPLKAFAYQDHEAHLAAHQAFMQDPKIGAVMGQNPMAQQMMASLMAHIAEHTAFAYRAQIEMQLGVPLPALDENDEVPIHPDDEKSIAPLIAAAAQRTMMQNQAMAAQQQAQQQSMDPEMQIKQAELQLKERDSQRKAMNDQYDFELGKARLELDRFKTIIDAQKGKEDPRLKAAMAQQELSHKEQIHQQKIRQQMQSDAMKAQREAQRAAQRAQQPKPGVQ